MEVSGDKSWPLIDRASHHVEALSMCKEHIRRHQEGATYADQLNLAPRAREIQQAGQVLTHMEEVRETRVVALRQDIENGYYAIKAEQVAEKLVTTYLLNLLN